MGIAVEVPGLNVIIPQIPDGMVAAVEGGADLAKSFFVRQLCRTALHGARPTTFITSRDAREVHERMAQENGGGVGPIPGLKVQEMDSVDNLADFIPQGGLLAVDSFSFLTLDMGPNDLARMLRALRRACRARGAIAVLTTDEGMFEPRHEAVLTHLAEGYIEFHAQEGTEGVLRFMRIPKWIEGRFVDRNIYYSFDGKRIAVDLRSRVL